MNNNIVLKFGPENTDIVDSYVYLGINLYYNGKLKCAIDSIANQATRAIFGLRKVYKYDIMDIETKLQLFHTIVNPVLLYGCEIWGFENLKDVEKIQVRFYKTF